MVAGITVGDDALGTETLALGGADSASFEIVGTELRLKSGVVLNFEAKPSYTVTVSVDDPALGTGVESTASFTLTLTDVNEAPSVALSPTSASLAENTSTASAIVMAGITVGDDALGTETLALGGADSASFEIVGNELRLKSGVVLNFEAKPSYTVTVSVDDPALGSGPEATASFTLTLTDVNEAPSVALGPTSASLAENTSTPIKVADIQVTNDALGAANTSLGGADSGSFEIVGNEVRLKSGVVLNFEAKPSYTVTVSVDDPALGTGVESTASFTLTLSDVNEAPTITLSPTSASLAENTSTASAIVMAGITVGDDALGAETLALGGADSGSFEIVGNDLRLKSGVVLNFEAKPSYTVTVSVDDPALGSGP